MRWSGVLVIDLRSGNVAHWLRFEGEVTELADSAVVPQVRCPRGVGPVPEGIEVVQGESLV